ncbi:MAG: hypothetical protein ACTHVY_02560 [Brevibacterium yomogidense]|uniref:Uncharacterized protein n=1 Tax=Brevibacterium yomogidense TaxID=946573 RepID=A0A1X6XIK7_9MICO|nr:MULTISPECIES: hypothetical protein [Brevibacterium]SLM98948.1 hypothetical protein FM105_09950 [Brevibacterium yomogidense]SMX76202.1 hypothetical protein BSP109_01263 [Brevibacterium sp. Mu109]
MTGSASSSQAAGAPDALPRRPGPLYVAMGVVLLEALVLLGSAVAFLVMSGTGGELGTSLIALCVMFAILGIGLLVVVRSLWSMHRWSRPATIAWQLLQALFGISTFGGGPLLAAAAIVPAVACVIALFTPSVIRAFDVSIAYYMAHPSAPAPPPKRW